jgi:Domain of unknown function (DUF4365)
MVPQSQRQEALSRAYVRAIAAQAGVTCTDLVQDFGADMILRHVTQGEHRYVDDGPQVDLQLKSTTRAEVHEAEVSYDLDVRAYDWIRQDGKKPAMMVLGRDVERVPSSASLRASEQETFDDVLLGQRPPLSLRSSLATLVHQRSDLTLPHQALG